MLSLFKKKPEPKFVEVIVEENIGKCMASITMKSGNVFMLMHYGEIRNTMGYGLLKQTGLQAAQREIDKLLSNQKCGLMDLPVNETNQVAKKVRLDEISSITFNEHPHLVSYTILKEVQDDGKDLESGGSNDSSNAS
jgi:hypothetical protein